MSPLNIVGRFKVVPTGTFKALAASISTLPNGTDKIILSLLLTVLNVVALKFNFSNFVRPVPLAAKIKLLSPTVVVI